jgi:hypothetical protein
MGLKDLLARLTKSADRQALERADEESRMTPHERAVDQEDYEARKDDTYVTGETYAGSGAASAAADDLED